MEVIILVGGLGTRLRSVVSDVPKCLAPVGGYPFLWYLLKSLAREALVDRVVLSVGYKHEMIESWIRDVASIFSFPIDFAVEEEPLGTGGAIKLATGVASGEYVVVLNGDTYFDVALGPFMDEYLRLGRPIGLALKPMSQFDRYGSVEFDAASGLIMRFNEKQFCEQGLINGGVYLLPRDGGLFDALPKRFSFERDVLEARCAEGVLSGIVCDGFFIDIGVPDDFARAQSELPCLLGV